MPIGGVKFDGILKRLILLLLNLIEHVLILSEFINFSIPQENCSVGVARIAGTKESPFAKSCAWWILNVKFFDKFMIPNFFNSVLFNCLLI